MASGGGGWSMASGSGSSSMDSKVVGKDYRVPTRDLPIVKCDGCKIRSVKKWTTTTDKHGNLGREFFKCPNHKPGGCDFWKWSDQYEDFLVDNGVLPPLYEELNMVQPSRKSDEQKGVARNLQESEKICRLMLALFDVGKDILAVLKLISALLGIVVVVQIISLARQ